MMTDSATAITATDRMNNANVITEPYGLPTRRFRPDIPEIRAGYQTVSTLAARTASQPGSISPRLCHIEGTLFH
jgi:hypothetical protein